MTGPTRRQCDLLRTCVLAPTPLTHTAPGLDVVRPQDLLPAVESAAAEGWPYRALICPTAAVLHDRIPPLDGVRLLAAGSADEPTATTAAVIVAGADGWIPARPCPLAVTRALGDADTGLTALPEPTIVALLAPATSTGPPELAERVSTLSYTQIHLLRGLQAGHDVQQMARVLGVTAQTASRRAQVLLEALGARTVLHAAALGRRAGLPPLGWAPAADWLLSGRPPDPRRMAALPTHRLRAHLRAAAPLPTAAAPRASARVQALTPRQRVVVQHLLAGHDRPQTTALTGLSVRQVERTRSAAYRVLRVSHALAAAAAAHAGGLPSIEEDT